MAFSTWTRIGLAGAARRARISSQYRIRTSPRSGVGADEWELRGPAGEDDLVAFRAESDLAAEEGVQFIG